MEKGDRMSEQTLTRAAVVTGGSRGIGRAVCTARKPACSSCCLRTNCRWGDALLP